MTICSSQTNEFDAWNNIFVIFLLFFIASLNYPFSKTLWSPFFTSTWSWYIDRSLQVPLPLRKVSKCDVFFFSFWGWGRDPYGMGNSSSNVSWDHTRNQSRCCKLLSIRSRVVSTKFFVFQCSAMSYSGEDRKRRGALPPAEPGAATPLDAKEENGRPAPGAAMPMDAKAENDRMVRRRMVFFVRKGKKNVQLCFETCKMGIYVFCRWEEGVVMRFNLLGQVATLGPQFIHLSVIPTDSCP